MEKHSSGRSKSSFSHLASDFEKLSGARANIWVTTATVLGAVLLIMLIVVSPNMALFSSAAGVKGGGTVSRGLPAGFSSTPNQDPSFDFRTDVQTEGLPVWTAAACPDTHGAIPPKGARPEVLPALSVQLDNEDAKNLQVGKPVKFKVFVDDCGWSRDETFANWRDNSVYLDGFTKTPSPLGDAELLVPENYYEQQGPSLNPGPGSWWSVNHVFTKPGTYPLRFRARNASGTAHRGGSTVVTFTVKINGSGTDVSCNDAAKVKVALNGSSSGAVFPPAGSQQDVEVGRFDIKGTKGGSVINTLYVAIDAKDGALPGIDMANYEAGMFTKVAITSGGQELGVAGGKPTIYYKDKDQIEPDFDRVYRQGIVEWGGVQQLSLGAKHQIALYPVRLKSPLLVSEGQTITIGVKVTENARLLSSQRADGFNFGIARVECGFGLNMIEGGSKYSTTAFTGAVTTPGFTKTCDYRPPHPVSATGGCYQWKDLPTCAWQPLDCSTGQPVITR